MKNLISLLDWFGIKYLWGFRWQYANKHSAERKTLPSWLEYSRYRNQNSKPLMYHSYIDNAVPIKHNNQIYITLSFRLYFLWHSGSLNILDSEWRDECIDFTWYVCCFFVSVISFWSGKNGLILNIIIFYSKKVNLNVSCNILTTHSHII